MESTRNGKVLEVIGSLCASDTTNGTLDKPVKPPTVTLTGLYTAPVGTVTINVVEVAVSTVAGTPPTYTMFPAGILLKFFPLMVSTEPAGAEAGEKDVITGCFGSIKVNVFLAAVPYEVVTATVPLPPSGTIAVMVVEETTVNEAAGKLPILTAVAPLKLNPDMVIVVPAVPDVGVTVVITGTGMGEGTIKYWVCEAVSL